MNFKKLYKYVIYLSMGVSLLVGGYIAYLWLTYIDETITSGQAYGFMIGDDKLTTYKKSPTSLAKLEKHNSVVYMKIISNSDTAGLLAAAPEQTIMVEAVLHQVGYPRFKELNQWDFYIDGSYFNRLSLKFCDERLCEIYRHRKYFEGP